MSERGRHLSEEQLARYQDGGLPARDARHLQACAECARRLRDLEAATAAYQQILDSTPVEPPPRPWRTLEGLISDHETSARRRAWWLLPALGAAVCLGVILSGVLLRPQPERVLPANELLVRSARMEGASSQTMVSLRVHGRALLRPAVLTTDSQEHDPELAHLAMLFEAARYSWREPLSARSFQSWRTGLRQKRDSVTVIHGGGEPAYRVRTDTASGVLRSAALTLRAKDLHATEGAFQFEGEEPLEMEEKAMPPLPQSPTGTSSSPQLPPNAAVVETPASPADTLHVLAALNTIGADVGEPLEIGEDAQHQVLVRAAGLAPERMRQIEAVLRPLPHVRVTFASVASSAAP
ncbi:MAG: hypothetical protein JO099_03630, partial [Acidobacteriia bacterium]|nr:hypothetical protein [Terriglobia bacterium]